MSEKLSSTNENDYSPVNKYIDEQSKLRRAKSFWINARSWALILIAIGLLAVLLAWAYSLLHKHYILKRVAVVQERVIEEKINDAISSGGMSKSVGKLQMLGDNQIAIEKLNEAEKALENMKNKNEEREKTIKEMQKAAEDFEKSYGQKVASIESEKLASLNKIQDLENQLSDLKSENKERDEMIKQLEQLKEKNENIKDNYYLFLEDQTKVNNKDIRVMTRYMYKDLNMTKPLSVDCYVDFNPSYGAKLADLEMGTKEADFKFDKIFKDNGFNKQQFVEIKKKHCQFKN